LIDDVDGASGQLLRTLRTRDDTMNKWLRPPSVGTGTVGGKIEIVRQWVRRRQSPSGN
jgi:hypothetical protein